MNDDNDIISKARDLLAELQKHELRESTKKDYAAKFRRLTIRIEGTRSVRAIIQEAIKTTKKSTWQANRAAIRNKIITKIAQDLAALDELQNVTEFLAVGANPPGDAERRVTITNLQKKIIFLDKLCLTKFPLEGRAPRRSKRQDLSGLPDDWQNRIINRMKKYTDQALVTAVTGCRPTELVSGVQLAIDDLTEELVAKVVGAKSTETTGQEWRIMRWPPDSSFALVQRLRDRIVEHHHAPNVRITTDNAKIFSGAMVAASKREWPSRKSRTTPTCMRHQATSDMKASGVLTSI